MNNSDKAVILNQLTTGYLSKDNTRIISQGINLSADKGKLVFLTGPNGAGKTTLLKTITGNLKAVKGKVLVTGSDINLLKDSELSKLISVVLTRIPDPGYLTVEEIVKLGRAPYTGIKNSLGSEDNVIIEKSLESLNLSKLRNRLFSCLSDGEKQKTMIARALCQDTPVICMDEPSSHLDFPSRIELVSFLKNISENSRKTIIVSSHDLNTALNSSDILWLIDKKGQIHSGAPEDLALSGIIGEVFDRADFRFSKDNGEFIIEKSFSHTLSIKGGNLPAFWTRKGLRKIGIDSKFSDENSGSLKEIIIKNQDNKYKWFFNNNEFSSIEQLLEYIKSSS